MKIYREGKINLAWSSVKDIKLPLQLMDKNASRMYIVFEMPIDSWIMGCRCEES